MKMGRERRYGVNWKGVDSYGRCDKTRQNSFSFPNKKERKLCKKKRRRWERGEGEGGKCLTFFQRYYKLSECSCFYIPFTLVQRGNDLWSHTLVILSDLLNKTLVNVI